MDEQKSNCEENDSETAGKSACLNVSSVMWIFWSNVHKLMHYM